MLLHLLLHIYLLQFIRTEKYLDGGYLKTCPNPVAPKNAVISYLDAQRTYSDNSNGKGYGVDEYHELDTVYFECLDGYSRTEFSRMYVTCGSNGKWFPNLKNVGKCILNRKFDRCTKDLFRCVSDRVCISKHLRCDCYSDCDDGSDEMNCETKQRHIMARNDGGDSSGVISSPGYPKQYPGHFSCIYHIRTLPNYRVEIQFEEFDIARKINGECKDHVRINGIYSFSRQNYKPSQTKCGNDKFPRIFSNFTQISINVSLGNIKNYEEKHRGFVLSWQVRSNSYIYTALQSQRGMQFLTTNNKKNKNNILYTVLTPVLIALILPISLILFVCFHRQRITIYFKKKKEDKKKKKQKVITSNNILLLTVDNLEKFNSTNVNELNETTPKKTSKKPKKQTRLSEERQQFLKPIKDNKEISTTGFSVPLRNETIPSRDLSNNRESYHSSNHSDHPRYVMSYDIQSKQCNKFNNTPQNRPNNKGPKFTNNNTYNNTNHVRRSTSQKLSDSLLSKSKSSKESRDNGCHSSRNSKSQSSCTFCNHRKSVKKPKRMSPVGYEHNDIRQTLNSSDLEELHNFNEYKETVNPVNGELLQVHPLSPDRCNTFPLYHNRSSRVNKNIIQTMELHSNPLLYEKNENDYSIGDYPVHLMSSNYKNSFIESTSRCTTNDQVFLRGDSIICTH